MQPIVDFIIQNISNEIVLRTQKQAETGLADNTITELKKAEKKQSAPKSEDIVLLEEIRDLFDIYPCLWMIPFLAENAAEVINN